MSTESLNRTSELETPSQFVETPKRVNVDVLKQRLLEEKKKEKVKRTIILSSVIVSLGALTMLTYKVSKSFFIISGIEISFFELFL